jgi:imidazolonepropionase-like amidohydrolase
MSEWDYGQEKAMSTGVRGIAIAACALVSLALYVVGVRSAAPPGGLPSARQAATASPPTNVTTAVVGARVFDGERLLPEATVVFDESGILAVGRLIEVPAGARTIDGRGKTLLPGLIDAHTHAFGDALSRALAFGVTTELDMFTDVGFAGEMRRTEQAGPVFDRADLRSAGTLVTAPGGHGTQFGVLIPTLAAPGDAEAFVDARVREGADYIKIVYDDGVSHGFRLPSIDRETLAAVVRAARARHRLAVVHVGSLGAARDAVDAGAHGLVHVFADRPPDADVVGRMAAAGVFVIPTLTVIESATGVASGAGLAELASVSPWLRPDEATNLRRAFPAPSGSTTSLDVARQAVSALDRGGIAILAGSDAPNPGTSHGVSLHRELQLLVEAGLSPLEALAAATSVPSRVFSLGDRGRIAKGLRADLLLVDGDPTTDIGHSVRIVRVWKHGREVDRPRQDDRPTSAPVDAGTGVVSTFDHGEPTTVFGHGWVVSTDAMRGGSSTAVVKVVTTGAAGSPGALEINGHIDQAHMFPWAGPMFSPGPTPMAPTDLSRFTEIVFWTRGDGSTYRLLVFSPRLGMIPAETSFVATGEWVEHRIPFSTFGIDGGDLQAIMFSAGKGRADFRFLIDEVRFQ